MRKSLGKALFLSASILINSLGMAGNTVLQIGPKHLLLNIMLHMTARDGVMRDK